MRNGVRVYVCVAVDELDKVKRCGGLIITTSGKNNVWFGFVLRICGNLFG